MTERPVKRIHVSCAIIRKGDLTLAVQRNARMSLPLKWEFPGGKIEKNETPEECLRRELEEELALNVEVGEALKPMTHAYQAFTVVLHPFICGIRSGEIVLHEHAAFVWLSPSKLPELDWAEADRPVLRDYLKMPKVQKRESL
ncbi:MAG: (deoxy)nucleoside triphosphate pyrophosphohydrolase [Deltaproteobacteria bacterium]|nr:(deoxy)nucleoside triphosphate pyrophosphohydrolase [Deltaproteobacteria bacterium]